ncbi:MAG: alpha/beta hydrolase family esterase [Methyloligellaceae bacterium]
MKITFKYVVSLLATLLLLPPAQAQDTTLYKEFRDREVLLEVPANSTASDKRPLILILHGALSNARIVRNRLNSNMQPVIDKHGVMVAYLNGTGRRLVPQIKRWNVGDLVDIGKPDDTIYIRGFIRMAVKEYKADPDRIYIIGHSNGAMMAYKFICEEPEKIAAIVAVSGTLTTRDCAAKSTKGVLHIHGKRDRVIPVRGPNPLIRGPLRPKFLSVATSREIIQSSGVPFKTRILWRQGHSMRRINNAINLPETAWQYFQDKQW